MSIYSGCWGIRQQSLHLSLQLRPLLAFAFISGVLSITGEAGKGEQENLAAYKASWRRCLGTKKVSHSFSVDPLLRAVSGSPTSGNLEVVCLFKRQGC